MGGLRLRVALVAIVSLHAFAAAAAVSNSEKFRDLETESPARVDFIRAHNAKVSARVGASANYHPIGKWLYKVYDKSSTVKSVDLDKTHKLQLIERGLGKPTEFVAVSPAYTDVLFSNSLLTHNISFTLSDFSLSPDQRYASIIVAHKGSIDAVDLMVYDLQARKMRSDVLKAAEPQQAWLSSHELMFFEGEGDSGHLAVYDLATSTKKTYADGEFGDELKGYVIYTLDGETQFLRDQAQAIDIPLAPGSGDDVVAVGAAHDVYIKPSGAKGLGEIRRIDAGAAGCVPVKGDLVVPESDKLITSVVADSGYLLVSLRLGADRWLRVYDHGGALVHELAVPSCCSLGSPKWIEPGHKLGVRVASQVVTGQDFVYDFDLGAWDRDPSVVLMNTDGAAYISEIVSVKSADGTDVPLRLTHRRDLARDGQRPVYFFSYGGFNLAGYLDPVFGLPALEFMKRGGVLAAPALRGGNEFGSAWHKGGMLKNKIHTFEDLAASAHWVIDNGWTNSSRLISTGTSNGGLTVSATALLNPGLFGLVLPISGVLDMLGKERMDARVDGWDYEYGDATDADMTGFLASISPVENVAHQGTSKFMIFEGVLDTRVNMSHALKLQAAFDEQGTARAELYSFKNAGHWLASIPYQNLIAWRAATLTWTTIFDEESWTF